MYRLERSGFACRVCGDSYPTRVALRRHIASGVMNEESCGREFSRGGSCMWCEAGTANLCTYVHPCEGRIIEPLCRQQQSFPQKFIEF